MIHSEQILTIDDFLSVFNYDDVKNLDLISSSNIKELLLKSISDFNILSPENLFSGKNDSEKKKLLKAFDSAVSSLNKLEICYDQSSGDNYLYDLLQINIYYLNRAEELGDYEDNIEYGMNINYLHSIDHSLEYILRLIETPSLRKDYEVEALTSLVEEFVIKYYNGSINRDTPEDFVDKRNMVLATNNKLTQLLVSDQLVLDLEDKIRIASSISILESLYDFEFIRSINPKYYKRFKNINDKLKAKGQKSFRDPTILEVEMDYPTENINMIIPNSTQSYVRRALYYFLEDQLLNNLKNLNDYQFYKIALTYIRTTAIFSARSYIYSEYSDNFFVGTLDNDGDFYSRIPNVLDIIKENVNINSRDINNLRKVALEHQNQINNIKELILFINKYIQKRYQYSADLTNTEKALRSLVHNNIN